MKTLTAIALLAFCACSAHAQLDHILAPIAEAGPGIAAEGDVAAAATANLTAPGAASHLLETDLTGALQKQLADYFQLKGDLKLNVAHDWSAIPLPAKDFAVTITDYPSDGVTNSFDVGFKVTSGGIDVGTYTANVKAQLWQNVWVSQSHMDRGQPLDRSVLFSQKVDALRTHQTLLTDDQDPSVFDVAQSVGPGQPLSKQDLIERPVIHKGDIVDVVANQGMMDIRMKALAEEDGSVNALIRMRNLDSSKEFNAQILNDNEVKVHF